MSILTMHTGDELREERRALLEGLRISEAELRVFAASWQLSNEEAKVLARFDQTDFLLGDDA